MIGFMLTGQAIFDSEAALLSNQDNEKEAERVRKFEVYN